MEVKDKDIHIAVKIDEAAKELWGRIEIPIEKILQHFSIQFGEVSSKRLKLFCTGCQSWQKVKQGYPRIFEPQIILISQMPYPVFKCHNVACNGKCESKTFSSSFLGLIEMLRPEFTRVAIIRRIESLEAARLEKLKRLEAKSFPPMPDGVVQLKRNL